MRRLLHLAILGAFLTSLAPRLVTAQPAPQAPAPATQVDVARATGLYGDAEAAMAAGRFDEAIKDFQDAYDITRDATLLFKLGGATEKAGKCADALPIYERYLAEGKPQADFVRLTKERIRVCTATLDARGATAKGRARQRSRDADAAMAAGDYPAALLGYQEAYDITSDPMLFYKLATVYGKSGACDEAVPLYNLYLAKGKPDQAYVNLTNARLAECATIQASASKAAADKAAADKAVTDRTAAATAAAAKIEADKAAADKAYAERSAAERAAARAKRNAARVDQARTRDRRMYGYIAYGAAAGLAAAGTLLALSLSSTQAAVAGLQDAEIPPAYEGAAKRRYAELDATGRRDQYLSWTAFGLAGVGAVVGTYFVVTSGDHRVEVTPVVEPTSAGVSASVRW